MKRLCLWGLLIPTVGSALFGQTPIIISVVDRFAGGTKLTPGGLADVLGTNLSNCEWQTPCSSAPTVTVGGKRAFFLSGSASDLLIEIPVDAPLGATPLQVGNSAPFNLTLSQYAPALSANPAGSQTVAAAHADGQPVTDASPMLPGETLMLTAGGLGPTDPVVPTGSFFGAVKTTTLPIVTVAAEKCITGVHFSGLVAPGSYQINFDCSNAGAGDQPISVTIGGASSNALTLPVGPTATIGISNSASGAAGIESGSWASIYGIALSATTRPWGPSDISGNNLPTTLDKVSVLINGKKAAISYVSPKQLNVQAPSDTATGPVLVQVQSPSGVANGTATLQSYSPAFFTSQGKYAAALHNTDGVYVAPAGYFGSAATSRPAQPGESLQIYGTGFGPTTPTVPAGQLVISPAPLLDLTQLHLTVGGVPATVQFAGIVVPGEYQINVIVPQLPDGDQPILATIGGLSSQTGVSIPIEN